MVESIYFLKPAWCGIHPAGLWPEQGLQPVTRATAFRRWISLPAQAPFLAGAVRVPDSSRVGGIRPLSLNLPFRTVAEGHQGSAKRPCTLVPVLFAAGII